METDTLDDEVVFKIKMKTGETTTKMVIFKPANDFLEKFIPLTILLCEDKFEIPVRRDDQEVHLTSLSLSTKTI